MINFYDFNKLKITVETAFNVAVGLGNPPPTEVIKVELQSGDIDKVIFKDGKIFFNDGKKLHEGYLVKEENYRRAYMDYVIKRPSFLPKFHTAFCEVLQKRRAAGSFDGVYIFANCVIKRMDPAHPAEAESHLRNCSKCKEVDDRIDTFITTEDFVNDILKISNKSTGFRLSEIPKVFEKDEWGYVNGWNEVSLNYRKKMNYSCEKCTINLSNDKYYLEVHHINGNKTDNRESNLMCLCVACHSTVDSYHIENYYTQELNMSKLSDFNRLFRKGKKTA